VSEAVGEPANASSDAPASWVRPPRQERSRETLDRLLDALEALLDDREFDEVSVADIAAKAGRTVGSFYGRFDDKDAALFALHLRHLEDDRRAAAEYFRRDRWRDRSLTETVRELVTTLVMAYRHPRPAFRTVVLRSVSMPAFLAQCKDVGVEVGERWSAVLLEHADEISHPDSPRLVALAYRQVISVLNQELLFGSVVPPDWDSDEDVIDDLTLLTLRLCGHHDRGSPRAMQRPPIAPISAAGLRSPLQQRSHETLDRFYDAAESLLAERTWDEVSVSEIAARAGRAVGSFYARFDGKDSLLVALAARTAESDLAFFEEMLDPRHWSDRSLADIAHQCVTFLVRTNRAASAAHRALMMRAMTDQRLGQNRIETHHRVAALWARLALDHRDEMTVVDPERSSDLALKMVLAVLDVLRLFGPIYPDAEQSDEELSAELAQLSLRMLGAAEDA
jgi:AcrR family transcriptional regulator